MPTVGAGDDVFVGQVGTHPCGNGFLAGVGVHEAVHVAAAKLPRHPALEHTDRGHRAVEIAQGGIGE